MANDEWAARHCWYINRDGKAWCAVPFHFRCLAIDPAGFGATPMAAVADLRKQVKYG